MPVVDDSGKKAGYKNKGTYAGYKKKGFWERKAEALDRITRGKDAKGDTWVTRAGRSVDTVAEGGSSNKKTPPAAQKAAARAVKSGKKSSSPSQYRSEVVKGNKARQHNLPKQNRYGESMRAYREDRAKKGLFQGKYYGPDAFKGDLDKVDRWRKAGGRKNDIKKFK